MKYEEGRGLTVVEDEERVLLGALRFWFQQHVVVVEVCGVQIQYNTIQTRILL